MLQTYMKVAMSKQTKTLTILTISMLVFNVILLAVIFFDGDEHHHRGHDRGHRESREYFEDRMSKRLGLSEDQKDAYEKLSRRHKKEFWELSKAIFEVKKNIGEALAVEEETQARKLLTQLDSLHQIREQKYFDHTQAIFEIFTPDQRQKFLETLNKAGDEHRKKRKKRREH